MNAEEFVNILKKEKEDTIDLYFSDSNTKVSNLINKLKLDQKQMVILKSVLDLVVSETLYTLLLGLDGEANLGGVQQTYKIYDEEDNLISECGELEAVAGTLFDD